MASTYSDLKIELIGTGEQTGTWGTTTNDNFSIAIGEAITGSADVAFSSADVTVTLTNTNASQAARNLRLNLTGTSGGARQLILGSGCQIEKLYLINNGLADSVTVKNTSGTGITVPAGKTMFVYNNGTNVVDAITYLSAIGTGVFDAGTVSAPSITFTGDTNTGIYSPAADTIAFTEGGVESMRITSTGAVGIGTTNPISKFVVASSGAGYEIDQASISNTNLLLSYDRGASAYRAVANYYGGNYIWNDSGAERMRIDGVGNVGIGNSSPTYQLDVLTSGNNGIRVAAGTASADQLFMGNTGGLPAFGTLTNQVVRFITNGSERARIDTSGNVGIGTTTMVGKLNVNATGANSRIAIGDTAVSTYSTVLMYGGSGKFNFQLGVQTNVNNAFEITPSTATGGTTFSTPALVVDSSGNVGIGTSSPNGRFESLSSSSSYSVVANNNVGSGDQNYVQFRAGSTIIGDINRPNATNNLEINSNFGAMAFGTGAGGTASERMRIDSSGNVGIGTSSPSARLDLTTATAGFATILTNTNGASDSNGLYVKSGTGSTEYNLRLSNTSGSTDFMVVKGNGNVGIGISGPSRELTVYGTSPSVQLQNATTGTANTDGLQIQQSGLDAYIWNWEGGAQVFATSGTEKMRITSTGNIGINTSTPQYRLDVNGVMRNASSADASPSTQQRISVYNDLSNWGYFAYGVDAVMRVVYSKTDTDAPLLFGTSSATDNTGTFTEQLRIASSGGSLVLKGGNGNPGGTGITFPATQNASSNANTLDDYEEGTWTPTITMASGTSTGSSGEGTYVKIGRQVTVTVGLAVGTISAGGEINTINGLPFTVRAGNDQAVGLSRENANTGFGWELRANTADTSILIRKVQDNSAQITTGMVFIGTLTYFV